MLRKEDENRLYHMLEAAREAIEFAKDRTREDLENDRQLAYSIVRCLEIIGEAASKLSPECRNINRQIEWEDIIGMRNKLVHAYFNVNHNIVWQSVKEEAPKLVAELEDILGVEKDLLEK